MLIGALAASVIAAGIFVLVSAGVISTAILVGVYKRSITAGFRTLLFIICPIGSIIAGMTGLYLINKIFVLHLSHSFIAWAGLIGGLAGGILLAILLSAILHLFLASVLRFIRRVH